MEPTNPYESQQNEAISSAAKSRSKLAELAYVRETFNNQMMARAEKQMKDQTTYLRKKQEADKKGQMLQTIGTLGGTAVGLIASGGNPMGGMIGSQLGSAAGSGLASAFIDQPKLPQGVMPTQQQDYQGQMMNSLGQAGQSYLMNQMYNTDSTGDGKQSSQTPQTFQQNNFAEARGLPDQYPTANLQQQSLAPNFGNWDGYGGAMMPPVENFGNWDSYAPPDRQSTYINSLGRINNRIGR